MYKKIRNFYLKGLWSATMVAQAVEKGLLTSAEYKTIIGEAQTHG